VQLVDAWGSVAAMVATGEAFGELALLPDVAARHRPHTAVALQPSDLVVLHARWGCA
jgi:hypothetical protein